MTEATALEAIDQLLNIMATLRSNNGCQWDKQQTPQSLKPYILEEAYELLEAIDQGDPIDVCDELGDLLLQVVFQAQIFSEVGDFTIKEVAESINTKLIRRHPHIFSNASHEGHQKRWEDIKLDERSARGKSNLVADRIPNTLPALKRAEKTIKHIKTDPCYNIANTIDKLLSLEEEQISGSSESSDLNKTFGEILLSVTALAQSMGVDAEDSLREVTNKMIEGIDNLNVSP